MTNWMTWGKFKKQVEEYGITDNMKINYIDISPYDGDSVTIIINNDTFKVI